jgi:O-antigen ligase
VNITDNISHAQWKNLTPVILVACGVLMVPFSATINGLVAYMSVWTLLYRPMREKLAQITGWPAFWFALAFMVLMVVRLHNDIDLNMHAKLSQVKHYFAFILPTFLLIPLFVKPSMRRPIRTATIISGLALASIYTLNKYQPSHFSMYVFSKLPLQQASTLLAFTGYFLYSAVIDFCKTLCLRIASGLGVAYIAIVLLSVQGERVGLVLFVIGVLFLTFISFGIKKGLWLLLFMGTTVVALVLLHHGQINARYKNTVINFERYMHNIGGEQKNPQTSVGKRLYLMQKSVLYLKEKPFFGYGTGSFRNTGSEGRPYGSIYGTMENNYLQTACQLGLVGLTLFLGFLISLWRMSFRLTGIDKLTLQGTIILSMFGAISFPLFSTNAISMLFAALVATSLGQLMEHGKK